MSCGGNFLLPPALTTTRVRDSVIVYICFDAKDSEQLMHACSPDRLSSCHRSRTPLLNLSVLLLLVGLLALWWPKAPVSDSVSAAPWLALETLASGAEGEGLRLDSANDASADDTGTMAPALALAIAAAQLFPVGPILGWHPAPCTLERARAPPALA
jgi:hypothetical protein